jgi:hypothetical protein
MTTDISLDGFHQVSRDSFFKSLGGHNFYFSITGEYPYTRLCKTGDGKIIGKVISSYATKINGHVIERYYIADHKESETCQ